MTGGLRGAAAGLVAIVLCLGVVAAARPPTSAATADDLQTMAAAVDRLSGPDRYATAADVSRDSVEPGVSVVYAAAGADFPDALAVAPVAGQDRAPVLLVTRDAVPAATHEEIARLGPERIVVVGGTAAVSVGVEQQLRRHAPVTRLAGTDRYATPGANAEADTRAAVA